MSTAPGPRPREVSIAGWVVAVTSAVLVVTVFDTMADLRSVDTREALGKALTTGFWRDLGVDLDDAIATMRAALFIAGAAAGISAVLGVFVLQRHKGARIALTIAAVPVVLTSPFSGGLLGIVVGGATAMLWTRPARDWFAGRPPSTPAPERPSLSWPRHTQDSRAERWSPPAVPDARPDAEQPPPTPDWGQAPATGAGWPPPQPPVQPARPPARVATAGVPAPVRVACILTWLFSGLTGVMYLLAVVAVGVDRQAVLDVVRDNPTLRESSLSDNELIGIVVAMSALVIVWCIVASVLAALTVRRHRPAWIALLVCVALTCVVVLLAVPYSLLHLAAGITTFVLLLRPGVNDWFRPGRGPAAPTRVQDWPPPNPQDQDTTAPAPGDQRPSGKPPVW
jgi:hypothetical protein